MTTNVKCFDAQCFDVSMYFLTIFRPPYFTAMKTLRYFVLIKLITAGIAVCAQPGSYYPPPSDVDYHNDTLTIYPPDSLPGDPVVLLSYNIYVDSVFYDDVQVAEPGNPVDYIFEPGTPLPGFRSFCAKAVYNEWISDQTCDTATLIYGYGLPFLEDWSSGNFEEQQWISGSGNWEIESGDGNPAPAAVFRGEPTLTNYAVSLESYPMNASSMTVGRICLDFDLKLECNLPTGNERLKIQSWDLLSQSWRTIAEFRNNEESYTWRFQHILISFARNNVFKVRFLAAGTNSADISRWHVDNIHIYRKCDGPPDLSVVENWEYNELRWSGLDGCYIDEWIHWDSGVFSGNSIGTGGPVEFDVAARWTPAQLSDYSGHLKIDEVAFLPAESSATYNIRVWTGEGADTLVVDQPVASPHIGQWNYVYLTPPVPLDITRELWIGYHINTPTGYPAGVDDGPAHDGYGNMMYYDSAWQTSLQINPALNFNWNISCHIIGEPGPPFLYIKIYREANNGGYQFLDLVDYYPYQDTSIVLSDFYCYKVTALWTKYADTCESAPSNEACEVVMLGSGEPLQEDIIKIYPNPAHDRLNIESNETIEKIRIYNLLGELILEKEINQPAYLLDVSSVKCGVYYLILETAGKDYRSKIVILR
jgi:hypothetical protein